MWVNVRLITTYCACSWMWRHTYLWPRGHVHSRCWLITSQPMLTADCISHICELTFLLSLSRSKTHYCFDVLSLVRLPLTNRRCWESTRTSNAFGCTCKLCATVRISTFVITEPVSQLLRHDSPISVPDVIIRPLRLGASLFLGSSIISRTP